jgi:uncharacterized protein YndB with AHSA1/START domain
MPSDTTSSRDLASVERVIAAPAAAIFAVIADPSRHREIDGSGTVREATEASRQVGLGETFGMDMKMGIGYQMANTIVEFEQDRLIAWQTRPTIGLLRRFVGGRIWRYELEPVEGGTLVRETWDIRQEVRPAAVRPLRSRTVDAMTKTLDRLAAVVGAS